MHDPVIYYLLWILAPVMPAYAMFKWLPSDATANGPFKGLKWKLSGAFAGYFLIVLISWEFASDLKQAALSEHAAKLAAAQAELGEPWTITGHIQKEDGSAPQEARFLTQPPVLDIRRDGSFSLQVLLPRRKSGEVLPPDLLINCDRYKTVSIPLPWDETKPEFAIGGARYSASRNPANRTIAIKPSIALEPVPASEYKPLAAVGPVISLGQTNHRGEN